MLDSFVDTGIQLRTDQKNHRHQIHEQQNNQQCSIEPYSLLYWPKTIDVIGESQKVTTRPPDAASPRTSLAPRARVVCLGDVAPAHVAASLRLDPADPASPSSPAESSPPRWAAAAWASCPKNENKNNDYEIYLSAKIFL